MTKQEYDNPSLSDRQFLEAVRNDETVPMSLRLRAAEYLLKFFGNELEPPPPKPVCHVHIGHTPAKGKTTAFQQIDALFGHAMYVKHCTDNGFTPLPLEELEVKGTA
jgi:hypothetical protein